MIRRLGLEAILSRRAGWLAAGLALGLLSLAAGAILLALSGWFITASALAGLGLITALDIFTPGAGIRLAAITRTVSRYGERLVTHEATFRLLSDLRGRVFGALLGLDEFQLRGLRRGDTLNRLTRDIDTLDHLFIGVAVPGLGALLLSLAAMALLAIIDPLLALSSVGLVIVGGMLIALVSAARGRADSHQLEHDLPELRALATDSLEGLAELRALDQTARFGRAIEQQSARVCQHQVRLSRLDSTGQALVLLTGLMAVWIALVLGLDRHHAGTISAPVLGLVVLAVLGLNEAWLNLPAAWRRLSQCRRAAARCAELMTTEPARTVPARPAPLPDSFELVFNAVGFSYGDRGVPVLSQFNLEIASGETVAVVGPSGSGKSTLALLAMRQLDPDSGSITLGGKDLRELDPEALRAVTGYLPQQPVLFRDTLAANLRLGAPSASDRLLEQSLARAGLARLLSALPEGLDTWVDEAGANFSGGQQRRIALARLLLTDPGLVILDEPTASLDPATASNVMAGLGPWLAGRTTLIITHADEPLPGCDRIIELTG